MLTNFPMVQDVPLGKPPLREAICQVRFPPILRLTKENPSEFQERIRKRFPVLAIERPLQIEPEVVMIADKLDFRPTIYRFRNQNERRTVSLAQDFYALSTEAYRHWPDFAADLECIAEAVRDIYDIPYATRVGLRYINSITADFTESGNFRDTYELLKPEMTAILRTEVIPSPSLAMSEVRAVEGEEGFTLRYGVALKDENSSELAFVLDFDRYAEGQITLDGLMGRCDNYHREIYNAFSWCIQDEKTTVFKPMWADEKEA